MTTAKELKSQAAAAFQAEKWAEAIDLYTQALAVDSNDSSIIANRSAAYVKDGNYGDALKDAQRCRELEPTNSLGYLRVATVSLAQKQFEEAMDILKQGIKACEGEQNQQSLQSALRGAQKALLWQLPSAQAARKMIAAFQAAQVRKSTLTSSDPKVEPLMQAALKNKQDLLTEIEKLGENRQVLDIVFHFVLDTSTLSALQALGPAWKTAFPTPDNTLQDDQNPLKDPELFAKAIQQVATETQSTPNAISVLILQEIVKKDAAATTTSIHDKERRQMALFSVLDKEGASEVLFADLAAICYTWACDHLDDKLQASTKVLVMMSPDEARRLDYSLYQKFLLSLASTWNACLEDVLDDLVLVCTGDHRALTAEEQKQITAVEDSSGKLDPLTYTRTKQLFELWDTNNDGDIDFSELLTGLRRYQHASDPTGNVASANAKAEKIALMIMDHDEDKNQTLDPDEFAGAMVECAKAAETDLHQLIDFMCCVVASADEDSVAFEKAYSEASSIRKRRTSVAFRRSFTMMTISIEEVIEEGDEEEEDDW